MFISLKLNKMSNGFASGLVQGLQEMVQEKIKIGVATGYASGVASQKELLDETVPFLERYFFTLMYLVKNDNDSEIDNIKELLTKIKTKENEHI